MGNQNSFSLVLILRSSTLSITSLFSSLSTSYPSSASSSATWSSSTLLKGHIEKNKYFASGRSFNTTVLFPSFLPSSHPPQQNDSRIQYRWNFQTRVYKPSHWDTRMYREKFPATEVYEESLEELEDVRLASDFLCTFLGTLCYSSDMV